MRFGSICLLLAIGFIATAPRDTAIGYLQLWLASNLLLVASAYLRVGPQIYGKKPNGRLSTWSIVLMAPYLGLTQVTWFAARLVQSEPPFNELCDGIWMGRRMIRLPESIVFASVFDLTAEFTEPKWLRQTHYRNYPILDGEAAPLGDMLNWVQEVIDSPKPTLIHCAEGHGRTGLLASMVLLKLKRAENANDALRIVQERRPGVKLTAAQHRLLQLAVGQISPNNNETCPT